MQDFETKFHGAMLGMALGDAIGELAYRFPRRAHLLAQIDTMDTLFYTGDTAMAVALTQSLIQVGDVDPKHLGKTIREHFLKQPHRCFGPGLPKILAAVEKDGISYVDAARRMYHGQGSLGNGAAMRVPSVGLLFHNHPDLYHKAETSATVTHIHPVGTDGAAVMAKAVALSIALRKGMIDTTHYCEQLIAFARTPEVQGKMIRVAELIADREMPMKAAHQLGRSVTVHESMPFALFCFLLHPHDFVEALGTAISNGGDCNTLGAMTGALCGAYLGLEDIPQSWREKLENTDYLASLASQLAEQARESVTEAQA